MKLSFQYGTKEISFSVIYRKRKTLQISVEPPDVVTVVAPINTSKETIIKIVKSKASWIVKKLYEFKNTKYVYVPKEFVNGESFMYLGRNYTLQIIIDKNIRQPEVKLFQGKFFVTINENSSELIKTALIKWYKQKGLERITERVKYFQSYYNKKPRSIKVKEQKKRWASCTYYNDLLFNWRCIMAPSYVLDYIIIHEMCHMKVKNHSKKYWGFVESIMPDYEKRKEWLKNNGIRLRF